MIPDFSCIILITNEMYEALVEGHKCKIIKINCM